MVKSTSLGTSHTREFAHDEGWRLDHQAQLRVDSGGALGYHKGYMFRHGQTPPQTARRPFPLRPRPRPRARGPQAGELDQQEESLDIEAEQQLIAEEGTLEARATQTADDGASHHEPHAQRTPGQRWRLKRRGEPKDAGESLDALADWLGSHGAGEADALLRQASAAGESIPPEELAAALALALSAMLAPVGRAAQAEGEPAGAATPRELETLRRTALCAYLRSGVRGTMATVGAVRELLIRQRPRDVVMPAGEAEQDRRLLLPLVLLHADRPRTERQRGEACERLALIGGGGAGTP